MYTLLFIKKKGKLDRNRAELNGGKLKNNIPKKTKLPIRVGVTLRREIYN